MKGHGAAEEDFEGSTVSPAGVGGCGAWTSRAGCGVAAGGGSCDAEGKLAARGGVFASASLVVVRSAGDFARVASSDERLAAACGDGVEGSTTDSLRDLFVSDRSQYDVDLWVGGAAR